MLAKLLEIIQQFFFQEMSIVEAIAPLSFRQVATNGYVPNVYLTDLFISLHLRSVPLLS